MKKTIFALLALILLAVVASCGATTRETPSEIQDYPPIEGLSVTITKATASEIIFVVRNDSETEYYFTPQYTPEKRLASGKWAPVEPLEGVKLAYDTILWPIPPGESKEMHFAWSLTYGTFPNGEYRILLLVMPDNTLCVPFTLPNDAGGYPWTLVKSAKPIVAQSQVLASASDVTPKGLTFTLDNGSQSAINLGREYCLQLWQDGLWYDLDVGPLDWTAEMMTIQRHQETALDLNWMNIYGELPPGLYRVVKQYWPDSESGKSGYVFCEFLLPASDAEPETIGGVGTGLWHETPEAVAEKAGGEVAHLEETESAFLGFETNCVYYFDDTGLYCGTHKILGPGTAQAKYAALRLALTEIYGPPRAEMFYTADQRSILASLEAVTAQNGVASAFWRTGDGAGKDDICVLTLTLTTDGMVMAEIRLFNP